MAYRLLPLACSRVRCSLTGKSGLRRRRPPAPLTALLPLPRFRAIDQISAHDTICSLSFRSAPSLSKEEMSRTVRGVILAGG